METTNKKRQFEVADYLENGHQLELFGADTAAMVSPISFEGIDFKNQNLISFSEIMVLRALIAPFHERRVILLIYGYLGFE